MTDYETRREAFSARVVRGIQYLDEHIPGWYKHIDVERLNLQNCILCVLGQLGAAKGYLGFSAYDKTADSLGLLDADQRRDCGFTLSGFAFPDQLGNGNHAWPPLTDIWKQQINKKRAVEETREEA